MPNLTELHDYLLFHGWAEQAPGPAGAVWAKNGARVGVSFEPDESLRRGIVERVAAAENRSPDVVARDARYLLLDVTYLRAANDYRITDTIPLEAASRIIASGKAMLRAAATTARRERAQIGSSYSKLGDEVVRDARMGHTERGSFIIPSLCHSPDLKHRNLMTTISLAITTSQSCTGCSQSHLNDVLFGRSRNLCRRFEN